MVGEIRGIAPLLPKVLIFSGARQSPRIIVEADMRSAAFCSAISVEEVIKMSSAYAEGMLLRMIPFPQSYRGQG